MIILMCGYPGSGKSTYIQNPVISNEYTILCPDDFRLVLTGQQFYGPAEDSVWSHVKTAARVLAKKHNVIIDATHLTVGSRAQWTRIAKELEVEIECWWYNTSLEISKLRNGLRDSPIPNEVMDRMAEGFIEPLMDEGFVNIHKLDGEGELNAPHHN